MDVMINSMDSGRQPWGGVQDAGKVHAQEVREGEALGHDIDHRAAIGIVQAYDITATGAVIGLGPGSVIVAVETIAVGTSSTLTLHDNASAASGTVIMPAVATATVNVLGYQRLIAGGQGALLVNGLYATVGGTGSPTFRVWAAPAVGS
jgi:hypothetical protein